MNTRALKALADVICRAQENGKRTPMGIAFAVESAGLLMSPETAAELDRLRAERENLKRNVSDMYDDLQAAQARVNEVERKYLFDVARLRERVAELETAAEETRPVDEDPIPFALTPKAAESADRLRALLAGGDRS